MDPKHLAQQAEKHLRYLCHRIPNRRVGAEGNRLATRYLAETLAHFGFAVETPEFKCFDWEDRGAHLLGPDGTAHEVYSCPNSLGCDVHAPLVVVRTIEELEAWPGGEAVLLLIGEIAAEQILPMNFPFFQLDHHQQIVRLLEEKAPLAFVGATGRNPGLAGGMYPFPISEDGDLEFPNAYMKDVDGEDLAVLAGQPIRLRIDAQRIPATGSNVIARKPAGGGPRVIVTAHIDAKDNTPGALDNGTGVVILMLLAELLQDYAGPLQVELLTLNGEDHYSAQGHREYLHTEAGTLEEVVLAINADLVGFREGQTHFSLYGTSDQVSMEIRQVMDKYSGMEEGEQWYQSDHSVFIQQGVPAMALTSAQFIALCTDVTHTPKDDLDLVDYDKLAETALALRQVIEAINNGA